MARAEDPLAAMGLSGRQYTVLADPERRTLRRRSSSWPGICGLLPAQIVPVIDELERRGFVARQRSETDRRRSVVTLTDAGSEILEQADALGRELVDGLEPEGRDDRRRGAVAFLQYARLSGAVAWRHVCQAHS